MEQGIPIPKMASMKPAQIYDFYSLLKRRFPQRIRLLQDFYFACFVPVGLVLLLFLAGLLFHLGMEDDARWALMAALGASISLVLWMRGYGRTKAYMIYHLSQLSLVIYSAAHGLGLLSPALPWLTMMAIQPYFILNRFWSHSLMAFGGVCVLVLCAVQSAGLLPPTATTDPGILLMATLTYLGIHVTQGFVAFVYDLYYIHQIRHIHMRNEELQQLTTELQKANSHKDRFLAMVSHDMRTPLNGVMGYLSLIHSQNSLDSETRQYVHQANTSAKHLLAVINDLLDLSQSRVGNLAIHPTVVNLPQTLQWVFETVMPQAREAGLDYTLHLNNELPVWVRMDGNRFAQILINLLGNAVKFTHKGHVRLFVKTAPIPDQPKMFLFQAEIDDTGIGIAPELLNAIFDPFVQIKVQEDDTNYLKPHTGSGLGLTISRNLAQAMDGDIVASSVIGQGSTFVVRLVLGHAQAPLQANDSLNFQMPSNNRAVKLLVVDDNPVNRKVLITTLKRSFANAQIDEADSGLSALERLTHHLYDAVIMDLVMPDLDGAEVVRRLRAQFPEPMRSVPVLGLTANLAADALTACKTAGMNEVMGKPFDRQQLLQILQKWLDDPESTQTSAQGQLPMSARESTS